MGLGENQGKISVMGQTELKSIWFDQDEDLIKIIDQRVLPHKLVIEDLNTVEDVCTAIREMHVRGAPLIGVTAGYGMYLACREAVETEGIIRYLREAAGRLKQTRPTAINCAWAVQRQLNALLSAAPDEMPSIALKTAAEIEENENECCRLIGQYGLKLIEDIYRKKKNRVHILTHCNAGWLACVKYGTATAPIYAAFDKNIPVHVWVDETRPRNQGARLTAWELEQMGVPYTVIADNTGGHLMQHGRVDLVIVGSDRTTRVGDVANKIGTYLKALAAHDNGVPFYVALPSSSIDWSIQDGLKEIPIEERNSEELRYVHGLIGGELKRVLVPPEHSPVVNFSFDITPSRLVTGLITERGICDATEEGIGRLFPEK